MKRSLRSWLWRVPIDQEVEEELAFHVEMRRREGRPLNDDGVEQVRRACLEIARKRDREMRLTQWLEELGSDVRFATRQLRAAPGFTFVAALTLALGIGANGAMFALADATLFRPLPFAEPERLVRIWEQVGAAARIPVSPSNFRDWQERNRTFEVMAGFQRALGFGPVMTDADGTPQPVPRQQVTARFFDVLGVKPIAGRTFVTADETQAPNVVVLSEGFWRTRFGGDPALIGREIRLGGEPFTVIGIVPQKFQFDGPSSIWTLYPRPRVANARSFRFLQVIGRLKQGTPLDVARSDMATISNALAVEFPDTNKERGTAIEPLRGEFISRELRLTAILFLAVVGVVLLMCCANVANLLLARATTRGRELAVRAALGAGRRRIVGQLVTESLVLAAIGGALGIGVGMVILKLAPSVIPAGLLPGAIALRFDVRVGLFCAVTALVIGTLFGLAPAWQATSRSLVQALVADGRGTTRRGGRTRSLLVAAQVAAAVLLLCGAGLLLRTLLAVGSFDRGYRAEGVLAMSVSLPAPLPGSRYPSEDAMRRFFDAAEREVAAVPGVRSAGWATTLPLGPSQIGSLPFELVGDTPVAVDRRPEANYQIVSPSYFQTVDLSIVAGRGFTDRDTGASAPVCIVNEAFVRQHLGDGNPIGARVSIRSMSITARQPPVVREIIGVARQVKGRPDEPQDLVQIYVPNAQNPWIDAFLLVRSDGALTDAIAAAVRRAVGRVDAVVPVQGLGTLEELAYETTARHRFRAVMVVTFAALALLLAMVGVFGVLAYSVQQRWREFGVRIALGASTLDVLSLVLASAARVITVGAVIGLAAAAALSRFISGFLFGVQPLDPVTFASVVTLLVVTAALAIAAPAFRATRVNPAVTFRND